MVILEGRDQMFERNEHKLAVAQQPPASQFSHDYCSPSCASLMLNWIIVKSETLQFAVPAKNNTHTSASTFLLVVITHDKGFFSPTNVKADLLLHMTQWQISLNNSSKNFFKKEW